MNRITRSENYKESDWARFGFAKDLALVASFIYYEEWVQRGKWPFKTRLPYSKCSRDQCNPKSYI